MAYRIDGEKCNGCGACKALCPVGAVAGEKKKPHAIAERDCIECGACGKVCPRGAVLDGEGRTAAFVKRSGWPRPKVDVRLCIACSICVSACPTRALVMSGEPRKGGVDPYPQWRDEKACIGCGFCAEECPVDAVGMESSATGEVKK